jgi:uncharacterized membrane protein
MRSRIGFSSLRHTLGLALAITAAAIALPGRPACADLILKNDYKATISVAVAFYQAPAACSLLGGWEVKGWYVIAPGQSATAIYGDLRKRNPYDGGTYYLYAFATDGAEWKGPHLTTLNMSQAFDICDGVTTAGTERRGFFPIFTNGSVSWSQRFTP